MKKTVPLQNLRDEINPGASEDADGHVHRIFIGCKSFMIDAPRDVDDTAGLEGDLGDRLRQLLARYRLHLSFDRKWTNGAVDLPMLFPFELKDENIVVIIMWRKSGSSFWSQVHIRANPRRECYPPAYQRLLETATQAVNRVPTLLNSIQDKCVAGLISLVGSRKIKRTLKPAGWNRSSSFNYTPVVGRQ